MFNRNKYYGMLYSRQQSDTQSFTALTAAALTLWDSGFPVFQVHGTERDPTTNNSIKVYYQGDYKLTLHAEIEVSIPSTVKAYFYNRKTGVAAAVPYAESEITCTFANVPYEINLTCIAPLLQNSDIQVYLECSKDTDVTLCNGNFIVEGVGARED